MLSSIRPPGLSEPMVSFSMATPIRAPAGSSTKSRLASSTCSSRTTTSMPGTDAPLSVSESPAESSGTSKIQLDRPSASTSRKTSGSTATARWTTRRPFNNGSSASSARADFARTMSGSDAQEAFEKVTPWASTEGAGSNLMCRSPVISRFRPVSSSTTSVMAPRYSFGSTRLTNSARPATSISDRISMPTKSFFQSRIAPARGRM